MPKSPSLSGSLKFIYQVVPLLVAVTLSACGDSSRGSGGGGNQDDGCAFLLLLLGPLAIFTDECSGAAPRDSSPSSLPPTAPGQQFDCATGDVQCLIQAINAANADTRNHDTINLAAGTYTLTAVNNTTDGPNGLPSIRGPITLNGEADSASSGSAAAGPRTIIERAPGAQPFRLLHNNAWGAGVTIQGLSFRGGNTVTGEPNIHGGAIFNRGKMTLVNSTVSGNHASEGFGGGIFNMGDLVLRDSTVSENDALADGGISNSHDLWVISSTISNNTSVTGGGGIGSSWIVRRLTNSTVSGNRVSEGSGGGIFNSGYVHLRNSTVSGNSGGGIFNSASPNLTGDPIRLSHTIVAGNLDQDLSPEDCVNNGKPVASLGHNLVGAGAGCPSDGPDDQTVDPATVFTDVLGPLQDNGGPTFTHALLPGSPAIDAGDDVCTDPTDPYRHEPLTTDQRGSPRPVDGDGDGNVNCDIGAFEADPMSPPSEGDPVIPPLPSVLDQEQPLIDTSIGAAVIDSKEMLAQVVTAGVTGILTEVRFPVGCESGDLIVEIQEVTEGIPNGVVLTSQTIPGKSILDPWSFSSLVFSAPVFFSAGSPFAIVLRSAGFCSVRSGPRGDPYPGGDAFFNSLVNNSRWVPLGDFGGSDLPFQTLVVPVP